MTESLRDIRIFVAAYEERSFTVAAVREHATQSGVSRIEHQTDVYLSTLRSFIEAMGGHLELSAIFPDGTVLISTFEDDTQQEEDRSNRDLASEAADDLPVAR